MTKISKRRLINTLSIICHLSISAVLLTACSMMQEDRSDCPDCRNSLHITLRYDYNIQRANMFSDHVEEATGYVVDEATGTVVDTQTAQNSAQSQPLRNPSFGFNFEGLAPGKYRLYATGRSKADASFGVTAPALAESIDKLQFSLPVAGTAVTAQRLDTLWNTLMPVDVTVPESVPVEATVGLMRLTNDLNVIIFRSDNPTDNSHERYDVSVTDNSPVLGYDNAPTDESPVVYRPFAAWTTETIVDGEAASLPLSAGRDGTHNPAASRPLSAAASPPLSAAGGLPAGITRGAADGTIAERNAHYDLSLARLISHDDARQNPRLIIRSRETGRDIVNIDLVYYLALARNAYEYENYSTQEYLDREYDYRLDFGFERKDDGHDTWKYMTIHINVLSWALRIQNEDL